MDHLKPPRDPLARAVFLVDQGEELQRELRRMRSLGMEPVIACDGPGLERLRAISRAMGLPQPEYGDRWQGSEVVYENPRQTSQDGAAKENDS